MRNIAAILACMVMFIAAVTAHAAMSNEPDKSGVAVVNRPVNTEGSTGLIATTSAYTQTKNAVVLGLSGIAENNDSPDYSYAQGIITVTVGVIDRIEAGVKAQLVGLNLGSSTSREVGAGDTDLFVKWRISDQYDTLPALAVGVRYSFPTGDEVKGTGSVKKGGARLIIAATNEKVVSGDFVMGVYVDGEIVYNDYFFTDTTAYTDRYGVLNAGILFTMVESRRLQGIVEYQLVTRKDVPTVFEQDSWSVMPGLRYVTERWNISAGVQFVHSDADAIGNAMRGMGTVSYTF